MEPSSRYYAIQSYANWDDCVFVFAVGWSCAPSFGSLLGEMLVEDISLLQCNISGLTSVSYAGFSSDHHIIDSMNLLNQHDYLLV